MKSLGKWVFNLAAGLSLVLFLATAVFWARSEKYADRLFVMHCDPVDHNVITNEIGTNSGCLILGHDSESHMIGRDISPGWMWEVDSFSFDGEGDHLARPFGAVRLWSFDRDNSPPNGVFFRFELAVRMWPLAVATAMLPILWFIRWNRRRKPTPGFCGSCGYDMRNA